MKKIKISLLLLLVLIPMLGLSQNNKIFNDSKKIHSKHLLGGEFMVYDKENIKPIKTVGIYYRYSKPNSKTKIEVSYDYTITSSEVETTSLQEKRLKTLGSLSVVYDWFILRNKLPVDLFLGGGIATSGFTYEFRKDNNSQLEESESMLMSNAFLLNIGLEYDLSNRFLMKVEWRTRLLDYGENVFPNNSYGLGVGYKF